MNIWTIYSTLSRGFRHRRFQAMVSRCGITRETEVLDVGGLPGWWAAEPAVAKRIVIYNVDSRVERMERPADIEMCVVIGDGCSMPFEARQFESAVSNSVIEHLGTWERQQQFADEIRRVGQRLWVQTPARGFPLEPHYLAPIVHWLPKTIQRKILPWFSIRGWIEGFKHQSVDEMVDELRLLNLKEFKTLFPDCIILKERVLGIFTKSYVAFRDASADESGTADQ